MGDIAGCTFGGNTMQGSLDDGVGLSMDGTHTMSVHQQVADIVAVLLSARRTIKAGRQYSFIFHQNSADMGAVTGAALGNSQGDLDKILIPGWTHTLTSNSKMGDFTMGVCCLNRPNGKKRRYSFH